MYLYLTFDLTYYAQLENFIYLFQYTSSHLNSENLGRLKTAQKQIEVQ